MGTPAATIQALQLTAERSISLQADLTVAQATIIAMQNGVQSVPQMQYTPAGTGNQVVGGATAATPDPALMGGTGSQTVNPTPISNSMLTVTMATMKDDSNDCAIDSTSIFEIYEDTIYAVITFPDLPANSTVGARWTANGTIYVEDPNYWITDRDWTNVCSYSSITPLEGTFPAGVWNVDMMLNGQVIGQAQFQVVDSSSGQTTTTP